jgi:flagellar motor switch protein FliG
MATAAARSVSLPALAAQAQALATAQPLLVADLLREAMADRDGVADAALALSQLDAAAAPVLGHLQAHEVLALADALLRQRSVLISQAEQVLSRLLAESSQRVLPLAQPEMFVQRLLPQALGEVPGQRLLQVLGLGTAATPAATRARLSQAEIEALFSPAPPPAEPPA